MLLIHAFEVTALMWVHFRCSKITAVPEIQCQPIPIVWMTSVSAHRLLVFTNATR